MKVPQKEVSARNREARKSWEKEGHIWRPWVLVEHQWRVSNDRGAQAIIALQDTPYVSLATQEPGHQASIAVLDKREFTQFINDCKEALRLMK